MSVVLLTVEVAAAELGLDSPRRRPESAAWPRKSLGRNGVSLDDKHVRRCTINVCRLVIVIHWTEAWTENSWWHRISWSDLFTNVSAVGPQCSKCRLKSQSPTHTCSVNMAAITLLLRQLHWLKAPEQTDCKLALLVYKCLQGVVPSYLAYDLCWPADVEARPHLCSDMSPSLVVRLRGCRRKVTELSRLPPSLEWSAIPSHVLHSHCLFSAVIWRHISSDSFHWLHCLCPRSDTEIAGRRTPVNYI